MTVLCLTIAGCAAYDRGEVDQPGSAQGAFVDEREIVALVEGDRARERMARYAKANGYVLRETTKLGALGLIMLSFEMPAGTTGKEAIAALETAVAGSTVGVNHAYRRQQLNVSNAAPSYANGLLNWPQSGCRASVPIGLIDTEVDVGAAGLLQSQMVQKRFTAGPPRSTRHGTEIASVLTDPTRMRGTTIYSAGVIEQTPDAGSAAGADQIVKALDWLTEEDVKVVNVSLAGPFNKLLALAVSRATDRGMIIVAAVGNSGPYAPARYPAAFESVIAVTAVDANGDIYRNAGQGPYVDIAAPGVDVPARSARGTRFVTGTSIAAPFVTARIAADPAILSARGPRQIRQRLVGNTRDLGQSGADNTFGSGLMQATGICGS